MVELGTTNASKFFLGGVGAGEKGKKDTCFFLWIPCEVLKTASSNFFWILTKKAGFEVKECSVKRSWMPEEAIRQRTRWRNCIIPHKKTKLQVKNDHGWGFFKEREADMKKRV